MAMIMAAGRLLAWKEQKLENRPFPEKKEFEKPLEPQPCGLERYYLDGKVWELRTDKNTPLVDQDSDQDSKDEHEDKDEQDDKEEEEEGTNDEIENKGAQDNSDVPGFLEHVVVPEDTLADICLRYKVKDDELRRLNCYVGNNFRTCDSLIVPNRFDNGKEPKKGAIDLEPQTGVKLLQSLSVSSRLGTSEAKRYLARNSWDLDKAPKERRIEKAWKSQRGIMREKPTPSAPHPPLLPPPPRNWLRRRGLRLLGKYPPKAAPVGRLKTGPARHLHRSTSNLETVSGATVHNDW